MPVDSHNKSKSIYLRCKIGEFPQHSFRAVEDKVCLGDILLEPCNFQAITFKALQCLGCRLVNSREALSSSPKASRGGESAHQVLAFGENDQSFAVSKFSQQNIILESILTRIQIQCARYLWSLHLKRLRNIALTTHFQVVVVFYTVFLPIVLHSSSSFNLI